MSQRGVRANPRTPSKSAAAMDHPVLRKRGGEKIFRISTGSAQHTLQLSFHVNFANLCTHEISTEATLFARGQCQGWWKLKAALYAIRTEIAYAGQYIHVLSTCTTAGSYKTDHNFEPKYRKYITHKTDHIHSNIACADPGGPPTLPRKITSSIGV